MSFHLQLLYHCFVHNGFHVVYEFLESSWPNMIQEMIMAPSFCVKLLSKSLACLFSHSLPHDQYALMALDDSEAKILCEHLSHAEETIILPDFRVAMTIEVFIVLLKNFCAYNPNQEILLGQPTLLPALYKLVLCYETDAIKESSLFLLLLELTKSHVFEAALTQCSLSFVQSVLNCTSSDDLLLRNISSVLLCHLQTRRDESTIRQHIHDTAVLLKTLDGDRVYEWQNDFKIGPPFNLIEVSSNLLSISDEGAKTLLDSNLIPVLFDVTSRLFEGKL